MAQRHKNYYSILNVSIKASAVEIKKAYRRLAFRYHPDRAGADGTIYFLLIKEAHDTLADRRKKADYDDKIAMKPVKRPPVKSKRPVRHNLSFVKYFITKERPQYKTGWIAPLEATLAENWCLGCGGYGVLNGAFNSLIFCKCCAGTGRRKSGQFF